VKELLREYFGAVLQYPNSLDFQLIITGLAATPSLAVRRLLPLEQAALLKGGTSQSFK